MALNKGKTGVTTSGIEISETYQRKLTRQRRAEERRWRSLNGPVKKLHISDLSEEEKRRLGL